MSTEPGGSAGPQSAPGPRDDPRALPGPAVLPLVPGVARRRPPRRPLPDAVAVRMLAIPDSAPPYDDELAAAPAELAGGAQPGLPAWPDGQPSPGNPAPAAPQPPGTTAPGPGTPARTATLPPGTTAPATTTPHGSPAPATAPPPDTTAPATAPPPGITAPATPHGSPAPAASPPPGNPARGPAASPRWPGTFAQVLAETLAGARPPRQIVPWTTDQARRHIQRLGPLLADGRQPRVRRVVTFRPAADVVEMTVIIDIGPRVRALAVRLERAGPRPAGPGRDAQAARWVCTAVEAA